MVKLLLATDFDGTASQVADGDSREWSPAAWKLLSRLAGRCGVALAVVSGRSMTDIVELTRDLPCFRVASFGAEIHAPDGTVLRTYPSFDVRLPEALREEITDVGMFLEEKAHGIALHWEECHSNEHAAVSHFTAWAESLPLRVISGRLFAEAVRHAFDKASALELIASIVQPESVIYCGDDASDESAVTWAAARGKAFFVRSGDTSMVGSHVDSVEALWQRVGSALQTLLGDIENVDLAAE